MTAPVTGVETDPLPSPLPPSLEAVWGSLHPLQRAALRPHLLGPTSADWLSQVLRDNGHGISATTIRTYRRSLMQKEV